MGLVNEGGEADEDPEASGVAFCQRFIGYSLPVLAFARAAVQRSGALSLEEGLRAEADLSTLAYRTRDAEEGMAAFEEKRDPVWRDE